MLLILGGFLPKRNGHVGLVFSAAPRRQHPKKQTSSTRTAQKPQSRRQKDMDENAPLENLFPSDRFRL